jgi:hypothetical protein
MRSYLLLRVLTLRPFCSKCRQPNWALNRSANGSLLAAANRVAGARLAPR